MPSLPCLSGRPRLPQTPSRQTASTLLPAWVHYLAQDLFVARWMAGDACNKRIPRLAMLPVLALALLLGPAGPLLYFLLVRPLLGKSATTPKGTGKTKAAPAAPAAAAQQAAPAKNGKQPAAAQQAQPAAAPAKKNGSVGKEAPAPAAPQQQQQKPQQAKAKKGGLSAYALAAAEAATGPAPKKPAGAGTAAAGGKNGKTQAATAPKPVERDIEDDRAFALAAAALLASRAKPQK